MGRRLALILLALLAIPAGAQTNDQALLACSNIIEQSLHDPRDARLEWIKGSVSKNKKGLLIVRFPGRAKNQYGALHLATFECTLRYTAPDNFTAEGIRVF